VRREGKKYDVTIAVYVRRGKGSWAKRQAGVLRLDGLGRGDKADLERSRQWEKNWQKRRGKSAGKRQTEGGKQSGEERD